MASNFQTGNNKIKLLTEYENVTQKVLFINAILAALMSGGECDVIPQNGDCSKESHGNNNNLESLCISDIRTLIVTSDVRSTLVPEGCLHKAWRILVAE
jgi:hypothetical protein